MPRSRIVKPEFFIDQKVGALTPTARLLYIGMWCFADDSGYYENCCPRIKAQVFPYDTMSPSEVEQLLAELECAGLVAVFGNERQWGWIPTFTAHQTVRYPKASSIPAHPNDTIRSTHAANGIMPAACIDIDIDTTPILHDAAVDSTALSSSFVENYPLCAFLHQSDGNPVKATDRALETELAKLDHYTVDAALCELQRAYKAATSKGQYHKPLAYFAPAIRRIFSMESRVPDGYVPVEAGGIRVWVDAYKHEIFEKSPVGFRLANVKKWSKSHPEHTETIGVPK